MNLGRPVDPEVASMAAAACQSTGKSAAYGALEKTCFPFVVEQDAWAELVNLNRWVGDDEFWHEFLQNARSFYRTRPPVKLE